MAHWSTGADGVAFRREHDLLYRRYSASPERTVGSRRQVWNGTAERTSGGLTLDKLALNVKTGRLVSATKHEMGKGLPSRVGGYDGLEASRVGGGKRHRGHSKRKASSWIHAVTAAKAALGMPKHSFVAVKRGTPLYRKAKEIHEGHRHRHGGIDAAAARPMYYAQAPVVRADPAMYADPRAAGAANIEYDPYNPASRWPISVNYAF